MNTHNRAQPPPLPEQRKPRIRADLSAEELARQFPGPEVTGVDITDLESIPLERMPVLFQLWRRGGEVVDFLSEWASHPDSIYRLAALRVAHLLFDPRAGRLLASRIDDPDPRLGHFALRALLDDRHSLALREARAAAVEALRCAKGQGEALWERCVKLEAGETLAFAAPRPWRKNKRFANALSRLSWHPESHVPAVLRLVSQAPCLILDRIRFHALSHDDEFVREFATAQLDRSLPRGVGCSPHASAMERFAELERLKCALLGLDSTRHHVG
ncbi:MAG: hypothetical protein AAFP04_00330 [Myxococcota bacterium]